MSTKKKSVFGDGLVSKIIPPIVVALVVGGAAPWWWGKLFDPDAKPIDQPATSGVPAQSKAPVADRPERCPTISEVREEDKVLDTGMGDSSRQSLLPTLGFEWKAKLQKAGYTNVSVEYKGKVREEESCGGPFHTWNCHRNYYGQYHAKYTVSVLDPSCSGRPLKDAP